MRTRVVKPHQAPTCHASAADAAVAATARCVGDDCARTAVVLAVDGCIVEPVIGTIVCTVLSDAVSGEEVGKECHGLFDTPVSPDDDEVHLAVPDAREIDVPTAKLPRAACAHLELRATVCRIAMSDVRSRACSAAVAVHAVKDAAAGCPSAEADARASRRHKWTAPRKAGTTPRRAGRRRRAGQTPRRATCEDVCGSCRASRTRASPSAPNVRRVGMTATAATAAAAASAAPTAAATAGPAGSRPSSGSGSGSCSGSGYNVGRRRRRRRRHRLPPAPPYSVRVEATIHVPGLSRRQLGRHDSQDAITCLKARQIEVDGAVVVETVLRRLPRRRRRRRRRDAVAAAAVAVAVAAVAASAAADAAIATVPPCAA